MRPIINRRILLLLLRRILRILTLLTQTAASIATILTIITFLGLGSVILGFFRNKLPLIIAGAFVFVFSVLSIYALNLYFSKRTTQLEQENVHLQEEIEAVQADLKLNEYYWETYHEVLRQTLLNQGVVNSSTFPGIHISDLDKLLKRYIQEHPETDLEYQESSHSLYLRTAEIVQRIESLLKPLVQNITDSSQVDYLKDFENKAEKLFQEFFSFIGLRVVGRKDHKDFAAFLVDTGDVFENLRIPNPLPTLISSDYEISDGTIKHLHHSLVNGIIDKTQIAILILFCDKHKLDLSKRRIATALRGVYAYDIVVLGQSDMLEIISAKEPKRVLRRLVLSKLSLTTVVPYIINGPTPQTFFFGREHELREISDNIVKTSYIIIGGRRIGKTSIVSRLHHVRLPAYGFRSIYYDCSKTPTINAFLSAPIRDWKPEPPANAPAIFGDLLEFPSDEKPLVLLLDEADKFVPSDRLNNWQLFSTLRALANSRQVQFVLSGERTLRDALKDANGPLFNFGNEILLGPLNYWDIEELITRPMKQLEIEIVDEDSVVRHIYEFTSGHPNVVQRLCYRLIERLDELNIRRIMLDDVIAITKDPAFLETDFLQTYWEAATPLEKIITLVLSQKTGDFRLAEVRELLSEHAHIRPSMTETKDALDRLVELRSILKRSQTGYKFAVEAFPRILVGTTAVEDLLEVLIEQYNQAEQQV